MRKVLWATLFVVTLLTTLPALAQSPNYDYGPVWRVTYYELKPGQGEAFWKDFRENGKPVWEMLKKEGPAVCRYDPSPGSRKSRLPSMNISQAIRKNQPPATETMEFQTRPIAPYGSSSSTKRCHLPKP